jgi:hypothetical protein
VPIDLGDPYGIVVEVRDPDTKTLTSTGQVLASVTRPGGLIVDGPFTLAETSTGVYEYDYETAAYGPHEWTAVATGAIEGVYEDSFTVEQMRLLVSVDDAARHLRAQDIITSPDDREQLRWLCQVATDAVERDLGVTLVRDVIEDVFDGGCDRIRLRKVPPRYTDGGRLTVTTVRENGITVAPGTGFWVSQRRWELVRGSQLAPTGWLAGEEVISVTYVAECIRIPSTARKVCLNGIQRMWQDSQQSGHRAYEDISGDDAVFSAAGVLTPLEMAAYNSLRPGGRGKVA